jgi:endonuclease/exonuclease/phosphatase (EEP) superfamily protein YafD
MLLCAGSIRTYFPVNFAKEPPAGAIKVLSYNIMDFGKMKGVPWEENEVVLYIQHCNADIVCLQEATNAGAKNALEVLGGQYPYCRLHEDEKNFLALLSKYPILSERKIEYVSTANASYAYEVAVGTKTVLVINNHLESYRLSQADKEDYKSIIKNYRHPDQNDSEGKFFHLVEKLAPHDSLRGMQADSVAAFIRQNKEKYIIACGDFNASPISYTHHRLTEFLNDAYTRSGNGPGISYHRSGMYFRLDHILISPNLKAYGAVVDRSIKASDHYPISCFISFDEE